MLTRGVSIRGKYRATSGLSIYFFSVAARRPEVSHSDRIRFRHHIL
ncbi:hypothetical protein RchiOBHm_Chr6g0312901 [Rosa chinensis]|uniref:Uncharacterized protein n=1 Tax=Rosa chinensis TaxID=74649 RepID=A0A2P6Q1T2_ROSCH|nr:hypothetical protein RchiOBHm_Chr6g0312901 [Rosa chinensis]